MEINSTVSWVPRINRYLNTQEFHFQKYEKIIVIVLPMRFCGPYFFHVINDGIYPG